MWGGKRVDKGNIGEQIVDRFLVSQGYVPYKPDAEDGAHPFDRLVASKDKKTIFIAEVKTKPGRLYYPDTGIDVRHYEDYKGIRDKYSIDVFLFFVDEEKGCVYGGLLRAIEGETKIMHNGQVLEYPLRHKGIIYFPIDGMKTLVELTDEEVGKLKGLSTRKEEYDKLYSVAG
jgi:hypothetical protein